MPWRMLVTGSALDCPVATRRWPRASESYQETDIRPAAAANTLTDSEQPAIPNSNASGRKDWAQRQNRFFRYFNSNLPLLSSLAMTPLPYRGRDV
jgi:hypothetical protein